MPVDTSMYGSGPTAQPNMLDQFGKIATIQNATNQNKLFQQEFGARSAMGPILQGAIDPATGQLDTNKLLQGLAANPLTAFKAPELARQALEMQAQQTSIAGAQQTQALAKVKAIGDAVTSLLPLKDGVTPAHVADKMSDLVGAGAIDVKTAANTLKQVAGMDGPQLYQYLQQKQLQVMDTQSRFGAVYGSPTTVNTGGQVQPGVQQSAMNGGGFTPSGPAVNLTLSPGQAATPQTVTGADGQPITAPTATFAPPGLVPPAARGSGGGAAPTTSGGAPGSTSAPGGAPRPAAPAIPGAGGAPVVGQSPQQAQAVQADVTRFKADQGDVAAAQTRVQSLQKAKTALEELSGPLGTGKGTEGLAHAKAVLSSLGIAFNDSTLNRDEAKKYLLDYARSQGAAGHSDQQLSAALGSNASTEISNAAALDVVKTNIGRERQRIAQVAEAPDQTGKGYGSHASKFASETDPRAFAWNEYSAAEQQKILSSMKGDAKAKFVRSLRLAAKYGFVQQEQ